MRRIMEIRTGRHPHEIMVLMASIIVGIVGVLLPSGASEGITHVFGAGLGARAYYAGLVLFSATTLYGIFDHRVEGLMTERIGLLIVGLHYLVFGISVIMYLGLSGLMGTIIPLAYFAANIYRAFQIRKDLKLIKSYLDDHPGESFKR